MFVVKSAADVAKVVEMHKDKSGNQEGEEFWIGIVDTDEGTRNGGWQWADGTSIMIFCFLEYPKMIQYLDIFR